MQKTVVITGANRGIGLSLAKYYTEQQWQVIATCRQASTALRASGAKVIDNIDVGQAQSILELQAKLDGCEIDLLINNAGILQYEELGQIDYESIIKQFEVNALGPVRVSEALRSRFAENAKLVVITSRMGLWVQLVAATQALNLSAGVS